MKLSFGIWPNLFAKDQLHFALVHIYHVLHPQFCLSPHDPGIMA